MSMAPQQAQAAIEKQIEILDSLHNATTRAHEFREWRQVTLTLIERVWPEQPARAQRFRRVPFSPAAMRADDKVTREAFERGCAEARRLLQLWSAEIAAHGLDHEAEAPRLSEAARMVGDAPKQGLEFAPVGDFMPSNEDAGDGDEATDEDAEPLEGEQAAEPAPPPPPARTPPPAPQRPAPPQARAQAPPARPAPRPQQPQRQAQPPARPAPPPPPAPARQPDPPRGKQEKRRGLREMLGLVRHTPPPPEPEVHEEPAPVEDAPAPQDGDENALRRMLELELQSLGEQGIEEHGDDGAGEEPRLEIENNTFLGGSPGSSGAPPMRPGGEQYLTLDDDAEDEPEPPPARPAEPPPRPAAPQRGSAPQRPAPPAQRPAAQQAQRPAPAPQRPTAPPQRPAPQPQQQRPAPMQTQRPQAPAPPPRPVRGAPTPPPAQPARPQPPLRPMQGGAQRQQAPPPGRQQQQQQPVRGPMPQRPATPPPAHHQQHQHQQQRPAAGPRPGAPAATGQRPGARPPERPAHLEVERFERPEPMPRRGKKRRRDEDEYDDQNALADALGALEQVRHDDGDDDYDEGPHDGFEHGDDDDDTSPGLGDVHMVSYVARTFIGLAADVDELGIPQGHQERVRLALLDLAHYLDTGNVTWAILRDAITLVMHYPALGRQALPLLMPYIETAA